MEDDYFTVICWFLLYISMNQPQVYVCPLQLLHPNDLFVCLRAPVQIPLSFCTWGFLPLHIFLKVYIQDFQYFKIWIIDIKHLLLFWFYFVCFIVSLRLFKDERMGSSLLLLGSFTPFTYFCLLVYLFLLGKIELLHFMFIICQYLLSMLNLLEELIYLFLIY